MWNTVVEHGLLFGDPTHSSGARCSNVHWFSYPGYSELLCGFADPRIDSNDKRPNPNQTVLEWLHSMSDFQGQVAVFGSWDVFPFIVNSERSGIPVNAGWTAIPEHDDRPELVWINQISDELPRVWPGVRYDVFTFIAAREYIARQKPRVVYLALGETDDWAHEGRYDLYLEAAYRNDDYLRQIWELMQSLPEYRGQTSMVITTDHGRGDGRETWKSHGATIDGSDRTWIAVVGPDTPRAGIRSDVDVLQAQVAATVAQLLGQDFTSHDTRIAPPLPGILKPTP
jgi:hypothetical protein